MQAVAWAPAVGVATCGGQTVTPCATLAVYLLIVGDGDLGWGLVKSCLGSRFTCEPTGVCTCPDPLPCDLLPLPKLVRMGVGHCVMARAMPTCVRRCAFLAEFIGEPLRGDFGFMAQAWAHPCTMDPCTAAGPCAPDPPCRWTTVLAVICAMEPSSGVGFAGNWPTAVDERTGDHVRS